MSAAPLFAVNAITGAPIKATPAKAQPLREITLLEWTAINIAVSVLKDENFKAVCADGTGIVIEDFLETCFRNLGNHCVLIEHFKTPQHIEIIRETYFALLDLLALPVRYSHEPSDSTVYTDEMMTKTIGDSACRIGKFLHVLFPQDVILAKELDEELASMMPLEKE